MNKDNSPAPKPSISRRDMLRLSAGATAFGASLLLPPPIASAADKKKEAAANPTNANLYSQLLQTWCDGLIARQVTAFREPALYGGLLCPACTLIHGRCGDAVYPLLRMAHSTGNSKYTQAAILVHEWSEQQVSRPDGSWVNDVNLSQWKGITVFHAISLAEALYHHGSLLDSNVRWSWTDRLARAAKVL